MKMTLIGMAGKALLDKRESFVPSYRIPIIKGGSSGCRMPDPSLKTYSKRRHGIPDIMEDLKKY